VARPWITGSFGPSNEQQLDVAALRRHENECHGSLPRARFVHAPRRATLDSGPDFREVRHHSFRNEECIGSVTNTGTKSLYIDDNASWIGHSKEAPIWNKFAVGMLAIVTIAAARVVLRRQQPADATSETKTDDVEDVANLYAAGL